ncbi:hypothetical protein D3C84_692110 [compost metagenome]
MSSDGCCQSSKTVGQAIADPGQAGQQDPLPASTGMRQAKDQRSQEQRKVFTMTQIFQPATQAALDVAAKQRLLDQCHQQQIVEQPKPGGIRPFRCPSDDTQQQRTTQGQHGTQG